MKKTISLLLLLTLILGTASCAPSVTSDKKGTSTPTTPQSDAMSENEGEEPLPNADMEGFELRFYNYDNSWMTWSVNEINVEEQSGDLVLDEIYQRNRRIEAKYKCKITEQAVPDTVREFKNHMLAGDDIYDIAQIYDNNVADFYSMGLLQSWDVLPYIDFSGPWWLQGANVVFQIKGEQFAAVGAFSMAMYSRSFVMLFNKDMLASLYPDGENLYELVRQGKWTVDKFAEIAKSAVADINGDGFMNDSDRYGIATAVKLHFGALVSGVGVKYVDVDKQGDPYFAIPGNPYALEVMQKIFDLHKDVEIYHRVGSDLHDGSTQGSVMFSNGQTLFHGSSTKGIANFRGLEFDIGILPYPKFNEEQEKYYALTSGTGVSVIPVTLSDDRYENVGLLLEAMSRDSYNGLLPAYRETTLKTKYARDEDSAQMLDIIFSSVFFDLGLSVFPADTYIAYMQKYFNMDNSFTSLTEEQESVVKASIDKMLKTINSNN